MKFSSQKSIAIVGGGPAALFLFKHLTEKIPGNFNIDIFEKESELGMGMPYSKSGANQEHLANVSANEIPLLTTSVTDWITNQPLSLLNKFELDKKHFHKYKVLPRLLLGKYLSDQFQYLIKQAENKNVITNIHLKSIVTDISTKKEEHKITVEVNKIKEHIFDSVIICTGHSWPNKNETKYSRYFDSPYPPEKLRIQANFPIAIRGSSLTAIDAIRTLARQHGKFLEESPHQLKYQFNKDASHFKIVLHSIDGLLPAIRFHLEDPLFSGKGLLSKKELQDHRLQNNGFVSLDFIFEKDFKEILKKKDPSLYDLIKEMSMEDFVEQVMSMRERPNPFLLFKAEYDEAINSIGKRESVYWKEILGILSGALNYPAKYLSAEDMLRLKKVLLPLIGIVIASVPQSSCEELLALHEAGRLQIVAVKKDSKVIPQEGGGIIYRYTDEAGNEQHNFYQLFIDCIGQPQLSIDEFPFKSLLNDGDIHQASIQFRSANAAKKLIKEGNGDIFTKEDNKYFLEVSGISITDSFEIVNKNGKANDQVYLMAVPFIGGFNPDYSGLGFCNDTAETIATNLMAVYENKGLQKRKEEAPH